MRNNRTFDVDRRVENSKDLLNDARVNALVVYYSHRASVLRTFTSLSSHPMTHPILFICAQ